MLGRAEGVEADVGNGTEARLRRLASLPEGALKTVGAAAED